MDRGIFLHRAASDEFVKNLSKSVQESFTNSAGCWGILWLSEGKTPSLRQTPFNTLFSFFHLFFLPSFSFCIGMRPVSSRKQGASLSSKVLPGRNKSFTGYSKSVHTFSTAAQYTKYVSKGSRNPPLASQPIFYFSFTPLFQICVVNRQSAAVPFPPTGGGALSMFRVLPGPYRLGREGCIKRQAHVLPFYEHRLQAACAQFNCARSRSLVGVRLSEILTKISEKRRRPSLAKVQRMRYT